MVENLVSDYISRDSCLILLTIACDCKGVSLSVLPALIRFSGDFMTQKSYRLAQKHDPDGVRTIGRPFDPVSGFKLNAVIGNRCSHETRSVPCRIRGALAGFHVREA